MAIQLLKPIDTQHALPTIDHRWQGWIATNVKRGCDLEGMVKVMVANGFDEEQATHAIKRLSTFEYTTMDWKTGQTLHLTDRDVLISVAREKPCIAVLENVLTAEECDELIARSTTKMAPSTTIDPQTGGYKVIAERTSKSTYHSPTDEFIQRLDRVCSEIMRVPVNHGEQIQVVQYQTGGQYMPHYDYFPPTDPGSVIQMKNGGQRVSTLILYLNDVNNGGATGFPELNYRVQPKKGRALYFSYTSVHGQVDSKTLHAGEPVLKGQKWIATKWMRQAPRT